MHLFIVLIITLALLLALVIVMLVPAIIATMSSVAEAHRITQSRRATQHVLPQWQYTERRTTTRTTQRPDQSR
jgi:Na+-translocating ferredoxin:NAD+ oxidoreductase RnfG subunit